MFENGFRTITDYVIHLWSWNFIHLLPMSQGCALLILRSKGQRSRSWRMVIWKWFPDDNWLCNQPMIMKLHTLTHNESRMRPIDFEVNQHLLPMSQGCALLILRSKSQRSRSWRMVIWKWFPDDNWLCNQPMIMKLHTLTHHESRMRPVDFEVKRSKVKVMDYRCLKRSRSWLMVIWKWFPDDNWLCNQPMIMKLHTLTHHESRMGPIDFEVKRSKVKVMAHGYLKMVSGR